MTRRMIIAVLALGGVFLAAYLTLYHYGYVGSLACGTGGCETVQASKWASFLGVPVAAWGTAFYAGVFLVAVAASVGSLAESAWPSWVLVVMNGWGMVFSGYLTWAEIARIHAICRYCVASATLVLVLFALSLADLRRYRRTPK